jgi:hypothetical protein
MAGFDAAAQWRAEQAAYEAQFEAGLAQTNPHTLDMQLPDALMEDGAS